MEEFEVDECSGCHNTEDVHESQLCRDQHCMQCILRRLIRAQTRDLQLLAGLAFYNLGDGPEAVSKRLALLFFILLLFELLPFCYMSFYVADRRFFAADVSNDLYHPSAYYLSAVLAGRADDVGQSTCIAARACRDVEVAWRWPTCRFLWRSPAFAPA